jgi:hypothetical protein
MSDSKTTRVLATVWRDAVSGLGPIQWAVKPPDFFWDDRRTFTPIPSMFTPPLGRAWYTGFNGEPLNFDSKPDEHTSLQIGRHLGKCFEHYALKERLWAAGNGTANGSARSPTCSETKAS